MQCFKIKFIKCNYKLLFLLLIEILLISNSYLLAKDNEDPILDKIENFFDTKPDEILDRLFDTIGGDDQDKQDKSYNVSTITHNIISRLSSNIYYRNNNSLLDSSLNFASNNTDADQTTKANDYSIYCSYGMEKCNSKHNRNSNNYANINSNAINTGININFSSLFAFGLGYGLINNNLNAYRQQTEKKFGSEKIKTHVGLAYGYADFSMIKTNIIAMFGTSNHTPEVVGSKRPDYNSKFFAANLRGELELNLILFSLHLIGYAGIANINTEKYKVDSQNIPAYKNKLFNYGLAFTTINTLDIKVIKFDCRLSIGYDYSKFTGNTSIININQPVKPITKIVVVNNKTPHYAHSVRCNANLNLQLFENLQLGLDANYDYGFDIKHFKNTMRAYGLVASVSYLF